MKCFVQRSCYSTQIKTLKIAVYCHDMSATARSQLCEC